MSSDIKKVRVLFNDSHVNLPSSTLVPQGGPSRFAQTFASFTINNPQENIELISLLFSASYKGKSDFYVRHHQSEGHTFYELMYAKEGLTKTYTQNFTKAEFVKYLEPWIQGVKKVIRQSNPDIVFLNNIDLRGYIMMRAASEMNIPVTIQHAGIWKKENFLSHKIYSDSIRKIFNSFDKEIIKKTKKQIFLNGMSRDEFFNLHNTPLTDELKKKITIIPLPIEDVPLKDFKETFGKVLRVGVVARWDRIKNHSAVFRLAVYAQRHNLPIKIISVTKPPAGVRSHFLQRYKTMIQIVEPMSPKLLRNFYHNCDIILMPSRFDVSPTVVAEALSQGVPVITSSQTGWVGHFKKYKLDDCIIGPYDSGKKIADTIFQVSRNFKKYRPRFNLFRDHISQWHSEHIVFKQYYKLFRELSK